MNKPFTGKIAIVTGAGRGIGAAVAHTLAAAGAKVAVNDINPDRAEKVAAAIRDAGGEGIGIGADVANKFQCVHLVETTRATWGRLDILINNAAVAPVATVLKMDEWDWQRCLDVNLKGTFFMSQLVGRVISDENGDAGGVIVNIASTAGVAAPLAGRAAFCASQAGIVGFARECAREYAAYHIRVNTVLPDGIDTGQSGPPGEGAESHASRPPGRPDQPQEIAEVVRFLCSAEASDMTGQTLTVDGGRSMR